MARRRRTKVQRVINAIRKVIAFMFSHVGLCALVVGYTVLGAIMFRAIERPKEREIQERVVKKRVTAIDELWEITYELNLLYEPRWRDDVMAQIRDFKTTLYDAIRGGYDGKDTEENPQWTFSGAFLYSLTVITTIGYGHIACRTYFGKGLTIVYAIIGIPLMLLFLTNIGDVMAKVFKFVYSRALLFKRRLIISYRRKHAAAAAAAVAVAQVKQSLKRQNSLSSARSRHSGRSYHSPRGAAAAEDGGRDKMRPDFSQDSFDLAGTGAADEEIRMDIIDDRTSLKGSGVEQVHYSEISVPISMSLLAMTVYLVAGAVLFCVWEKWDFLDGFYFCFISLTTIGFGDFVPGASIRSDSGNAQEKLVICSVYLLFGMALIAMCINLAQEGVVNKVTKMASKIGMVKGDND